MRRVPRRLADAGPCVLLLDHSTKAMDNPLHPSGSKRKRAAINGASYLVTAKPALSREAGGKLHLTCAKDRHGHAARRNSVAAEIEFTVYPDAGATVHVWTVAESANPKADRLEDLTRVAVATAKNAGRLLSQRELVAGMNIRAGTDDKKAGIDRAVGLGCLRTEDGPRAPP